MTADKESSRLRLIVSIPMDLSIPELQQFVFCTMKYSQCEIHKKSKSSDKNDL